MLDTEKRWPGRPVEKPMPEPIPDTPENIMRAILNTPPKSDDEIELEMRFSDKSIDQETLDELTKIRLHIEMEEPPIKRLLDALCHFELLVALGYETRNPSVPLWRRAVMQVVSQASYARKLA